ncbi:MAG: CocE/NonD family hydrolase [Blastocatellia bacterium]|nr:CocE/NonD family hydrolase [Blastocatellia bacterium]
MKNRFLSRSSISLIFISLLATVAAGQDKPAASARPLEGIWQGALDTGAIKLRLVLRISKAQDGSFAASLDSLDQGARGIPVSSVVYKDRFVSLELQSVGGSYEGTMSEDGSEITGQWKQGGAVMPLTLKRDEKLPEMRRPQEPKKPYPYDEEEVVYDNPEAGVKLAGTLTFPRAEGPFPAVLLITGSGPQDRDEALLGHRPFLVLADYLTRRGIAVLRVDDRGVGESTGDFGKATSEDFASDALAGIEFLKGRKEIDARRIGLIGHSEGGMIAPMVAAKSSDVAFIVLMAGPGITGEEILYMQGALIARANGASDEMIAKSRAAQEHLFTVMKEEKDLASAEKRLREEAAARMSQLTEEEKRVRGTSEATLDGNLRRALTPWFRYFLTYNPRPALMKVKCPVLAVNGEKDLQVPAGENLLAIAQALEAGGNSDYTVMKLPSLNHLFQTSRTGSPAEYAAIEETMSPVALRTIAGWIEMRTAKR